MHGDRVRKAKARLELNLARAIEGQQERYSTGLSAAEEILGKCGPTADWIRGPGDSIYEKG